jgi:hypothetical protein
VALLEFTTQHHIVPEQIPPRCRLAAKYVIPVELPVKDADAVAVAGSIVNRSAVAVEWTAEVGRQKGLRFVYQYQIPTLPHVLSPFLSLLVSSLYKITAQVAMLSSYR